MNKISIKVISPDEKGDKENLIENLISNLEKDENIYCGYDTLKDLKLNLSWQVTGEENVSFKPEDFDEIEIFNLIKKSSKLCPDILESNVYVYVFPTVNEFTIGKMDGVGGNFSNKKVMLLFVNQRSTDWRDALKETFFHELAHVLSPYYDVFDMTLSEGFVFDGIAEHFHENIINGRKSQFATVLSKEKAREIFNELKSKLGSTDVKLYNEVFYGTGKYPHWSGYSIGYHLVKDYLKKFNKPNWKKIINTNPKEILKESGWI
ncbi:MAG: hypothetical protein IIA85_00955 [Nanoarchaeota archaeon]|nr:hypothetical protein [Nanoarchaeota archaeon]